MHELGLYTAVLRVGFWITMVFMVDGWVAGRGQTRLQCLGSVCEDDHANKALQLIAARYLVGMPES